MRALTAFFAGVGTMVIVVVGGLGGGLLIADTMNPKTSVHEATKLERRTAFEPSPSPSPSPSPRLAAPQPVKSDVKSDVESKPAPVVSPSAEPARREAHDQAAAPDAAFAKAQQSDLKTRDPDTKRSAERRHAERRQQWAERRRMQRSPDPDRRDVEQEARENTGPRRIVEEQEQEPAVMELPRIRLFDGF
jgi:hypothetical protein